MAQYDVSPANYNPKSPTYSLPMPSFAFKSTSDKDHNSSMIKSKTGVLKPPPGPASYTITRQDSKSQKGIVSCFKSKADRSGDMIRPMLPRVKFEEPGILLLI